MIPLITRGSATVALGTIILPRGINAARMRGCGLRTRPAALPSSHLPLSLSLSLRTYVRECGQTETCLHYTQERKVVFRETTTQHKVQTRPLSKYVKKQTAKGTHRSSASHKYVGSLLIGTLNLCTWANLPAIFLDISGTRISGHCKGRD